MSDPRGRVGILRRTFCEPNIPTKSLRKTRHLRDAMAEALRDYVNTIQFSTPAHAEPRGFAEVYRDWAKFEDRALSANSGGKLPAATVLPGSIRYPGDTLSPRMDPDSWHRDSEDGQLYGLWIADEAEVQFLLVARATSAIQRDAINLAIETAFYEPGTPGYLTKSRKGILLDMKSYFGRKARFTLLSQQNLDSEASARENRWIAQFEILGHSDLVQKVLTPRFKPRITLSVNPTDSET